MKRVNNKVDDYVEMKELSGLEELVFKLEDKIKAI
jgi:hypothetical protein